MMSYSIDFRRHVMAQRQRDGLSFSATATRFGVGVATLKRWSKHIEPRSYKRKSRKIDLARLREDVRDYPDAYQYERAARFGVTPKAIWKALRELAVTYKKSAEAPEGGRQQTAPLPEQD
jgi:transposase